MRARRDEGPFRANRNCRGSRVSRLPAVGARGGLDLGSIFGFVERLLVCLAGFLGLGG
jgi:hypothetical protein